jgi:hypothetical protein
MTFFVFCLVSGGFQSVGTFSEFKIPRSGGHLAKPGTPGAMIAPLGAVLKKIKILGFGGPGLKIRVLKERSCPAPVLEGEGRVYNIFGARAF